METLIIPLGFLVMALVVCVRFIIPRDVRHEVMGEVIHDILKGVWHVIFGPRKVRVVEDKRTRLPGVEVRPRQSGRHE